MFCIYCGATLPEGAKKCTLCGNPVVRTPEATAQPVSEPESESAPHRKRHGACRGRHLLKFDREPLRSGTDTRS